MTPIHPSVPSEKGSISLETLNALASDEDSPDVIMVIDQETGAIREASASVRRYGYTPSELLGKQITEFLHPEDVQHHQSIRTIRGADTDFFTKTMPVELRYLDKTAGGYRWCQSMGRGEMRVVYETVEGKQVPREERVIITVLRDITARRSLEERLADNAAQLTTMFDDSYSLIGMLDTEGRLLRANKTALNMIGAQEASVLGKYFWETPWWSHDPALQKRLQEEIAAAAQGATIKNTAVHPSIGGEPRTIEYALKPVKDADSKVRYIVPEGRDITEHVKAIEHLARARNTLQLAINQSPTGIVIAEAPDGRISMLNPAAVRIRYGDKMPDSYSLEGTPFEAYTSKWTVQHVDGRPYDTDDLPLAKAIRDGKTTVNSEAVLVRDDGERRMISINAAPIKDNEGRITAGIAIFTDTTEAHHGIERQKELEQMLGQAQKHEAIGALAGGVAHDLNNILQILMFECGEITAEIAKAREKGAYIPGAIDGAMEQANKALDRERDLLRQLLTFARQQPTAMHPLNPEPLIKGMCSFLGTALRVNSIDIGHNATSRRHINADITQFEQLVQNLVINARDAMSVGGKVYIESQDVAIAAPLPLNDIPALRFYSPLERNTLPPGEYVKVSVVDNGTGIEQKVLDRIFDPYFTTKPQGKGTGLGLATVLGVAKGHKAYIDVITSTGEGSGTRFDVYFPAIRGQEEAKAGESAHFVRGSGKILIVDDERPIRFVFEKTLKDLGYTTFTAENGQEGLDIYLREKPDLVITDMAMPVMTGAVMLERMYQHDPTVKALIISGNFPMEEYERLREQGAVSIVEKPFTPADITRHIAQVLKGK